uniref:Sideroflexin 4 n=1 Tax=Cyprinus carpio carpio TaxID=630221 RepID=A0A9J8A2G7_CYPCA
DPSSVSRCIATSAHVTNATATKDNKMSMKQSILIVGTVAYSTFAGVREIFVTVLASQSINHFHLMILSCPAAFSVRVVRSKEADNGIRVFDSNGNLVGVSKAAGSKDINETLVQRNPMIIAPVRHISSAIIFGLMIPVSFSLFPQVGKIKKENLEEEFQSLDGNSELFYHRGL